MAVSELEEADLLRCLEAEKARLRDLDAQIKQLSASRLAARKTIATYQAEVDARQTAGGPAPLAPLLQPPGLPAEGSRRVTRSSQLQSSADTVANCNGNSAADIANANVLVPSVMTEDPLDKIATNAQLRPAQKKRRVVEAVLNQQRWQAKGLCPKKIWEQLPPTVRAVLFDSNAKNCTTFLHGQLRTKGPNAWLRQSQQNCTCDECRKSTGATGKYSLLHIFPASWTLFSKAENQALVAAWRSLPLIDPESVERLRPHVELLTLAASRQVILGSKKIEARPATAERRRACEKIPCNVCDDVGRDEPVQHVLFRFPLHYKTERMGIVLITMRYFRTMKTVHAVDQFEDELGGTPCTNFLLSKTHMGRHKRSGDSTEDGDYTWVDLYKIVDVQAVIGGRHVPEAARANGGGGWGARAGGDSG